MSQRLIIVVTAADAGFANTNAKAIDLIGGEYTFTVGLSPTGEPPATHYWCNWLMSDADADTLLNRFDQLIRLGRIFAYDAATTTPEQVLADRGLQTFSTLPH